MDNHVAADTNPRRTTLPSHPAPTGASAAEGRTDAGAARALDHTTSWKPSFERRQSFNKEDQKHALQMTSIDAVKTGPGFTERG